VVPDRFEKSCPYAVPSTTSSAITLAGDDCRSSRNIPYQARLPWLSVRPIVEPEAARFSSPSVRAFAGSTLRIRHDANLPAPRAGKTRTIRSDRAVPESTGAQDGQRGWSRPGACDAGVRFSNFRSRRRRVKRRPLEARSWCSRTEKEHTKS
jgi:hypothetical protein